MIFNCVYCDYKTSKKNSYLVHQRSNKHHVNQKKYLSKFGESPNNHSEIEDSNPMPNIYKASTQKNSRSKINKSNESKSNHISKSKTVGYKLKKEYEPEIEEIDQIDLEFDIGASLLNDLPDPTKDKNQEIINQKNKPTKGKNMVNDVIRLVSFSNLDDFYKTVSNSFLQQIRFFAEFELLELNKPQQEAFDYIKKKYCYLEHEIYKELLKDLKLSLIVSNFIDDNENPFEINN
jgi:hypothetical protein